jgi:transposase
MKMNKKELMGLEKEAMLDILLTVITAQAEEIAELKAQIGQNSGNSGKPPSSDGLKKPTVEPREKSEKKAGGQRGHKGHGLKVDREPNETIKIEPTECSECGASVVDAPMKQSDIKYVYDVEVEVKLTKYEIYETKCPNCGASVRGESPNECVGTVNYGNGLRSMCVVLTQYAHVGIEKTRKILQDLVGLPISAGTIASIQKQFAAKAEGTIEEIKAKLLRSGVLHADETGMRVAGKTEWFHVASNSKYTLVSVHKKRGREGSEAGGVLGEYEGTLVHDCWKPYFGFDKARHALCCAHLLRELTAQTEQGYEWATDMKSLLLDMKTVVDRFKDNDKTELSRYYRNKFKARYDEILEKAKTEIPPSSTRKKSKAENLLIRLEDYRTEITRFTADFEIPFDNNQAERDIRNNKVKQKVSGCFRTQDGAENFAKTSSVIGTVVKFGHSVINSVRSVFNSNNPLFFQPTE